MKIKEECQLFIYQEFHKMNTKWDLLVLLNYAKGLIYGEKTLPFEIKQLSYYSNPKIKHNRYVQFEVKKKSGQPRTINAPVKGLKEIQKSLNLVLQCVFKPHPAATGFVTGKSVVDNAKIHVGSYYVYNIDLKDFFHSVDQARVWKCLQNKPISLASRNFPCSEDKLFLNELGGINSITVEKQKKYQIVNIISALACTEITIESHPANGPSISTIKNVLPQGAPTSPILTNLVCQRLDFLLAATARRFGLRYSRYADDITFSSLHNVYQEGSEFLGEMNRIISDQGFVVNEAKTRLQKDCYRQEVTGLIVNDKVNVRTSYVKELRMWLYTWEKYGRERTQSMFNANLKPEQKQTGSDIIKVILGKLEYLKMVKGTDNMSYLKLKERFDELNRPDFKINKLLAIWTSQGIEIAMEHYYASTLSVPNGKIKN